VGKKIAVIKELCSLTLSSEAQSALNRAINTLVDLGANVYEISIPSLLSAYASYYTVSSAEASSNLSRFDGVRFGYRSSRAKTLDKLYTESRSEGFGHEVKRRILFGATALCEDFKEDIYGRAISARKHVTEDMLCALANADLLICPTTSGVAYPAGERKDELFDAYTKDDLLCVPASLAGLPAISLPFSEKSSLPVGIQLIANRFCEGKLLNAARLLLDATVKEESDE
jgi:aspartyl-tRNA(Asn)/glutamyl-tRNA(Gln) amidotransferase subunit A